MGLPFGAKRLPWSPMATTREPHGGELIPQLSYPRGSSGYRYGLNRTIAFVSTTRQALARDNHSP